jgi:hypothetical protein
LLCVGVAGLGRAQARDAGGGQDASRGPREVVSPSQKRTSRVSGRVVLDEYPIADGRQWVVEIGACKAVKTAAEPATECPLNVTLRREGILLASKPAFWSTSTRKPVKRKINLSDGVGAPSEPLKGFGWETGEEEGGTFTFTRALVLAPDVPAVLVSQATGLEHTKRHHEVFAAVGDKLERVWQAEEGTGPAYISTAVVPIDDAHEGIVMFDGFSHTVAYDDQPDQLTARLLAWDEAKHAMSKRPSLGLVRAVVLGRFASVSDAIQAREARADCLSSTYVLPGKQVKSPNRFVLATLTVGDDSAARVVKRVAACAPGLRATVTPF